MCDHSQSLRDQIDEAIARVGRELEILRSPSSIGGASDDRGVIADLETEYRELREARARVDPREA
jgi:hypothetical protein